MSTLLNSIDLNPIKIIMRFINKGIIDVIVSHGIVYPTPSNLNYFWGFGSIAFFLLA